VDVDSFALDGTAGDVFLLCSDGLSAMVGDVQIAGILASAATLQLAGTALIDAANEAGGRDNITVLLFRLEAATGRQARQSPRSSAAQGRVSRPAPDDPTEPLAVGSGTVPAIEEAAAGAEASVVRIPRPGGSRQIAPRMPGAGAARARMRAGRLRLARTLLATGVVLALLVTALVVAGQAVYFVSTDRNGQVAIYNGLPYTLPFGVHLYTEYFVSGVTVAEISSLERSRLFNDQLRSQVGASNLVRQLELDEIQGQ
jgi:protein phosphatase